MAWQLPFSWLGSLEPPGKRYSFPWRKSMCRGHVGRNRPGEYLRGRPAQPSQCSSWAQTSRHSHRGSRFEWDIWGVSIIWAPRQQMEQKYNEIVKWYLFKAIEFCSGLSCSKPQWHWSPLSMSLIENLRVIGKNKMVFFPMCLYYLNLKHVPISANFFSNMVLAPLCAQKMW